jgi:flagellar hook-basal body complex protein FliE
MSGSVGQVNRLVPGLEGGIQPNPPVVKDGDRAKFTEVFGKLLNSVNDIHMDAAKAQKLLASGDAADLHQVMIAIEEAGIATELLLEIRNRLVDAYQTMMRMPM